jgi:hypothetical protein
MHASGRKGRSTVFVSAFVCYFYMVVSRQLRIRITTGTGVFPGQQNVHDVCARGTPRSAIEANQLHISYSNTYELLIHRRKLGRRNAEAES